MPWGCRTKYMVPLERTEPSLAAYQPIRISLSHRRSSPQPFTAALLEDGLRQAVPTARVPCPPLDGGPGRFARWGEQLDVRNLTTGGDEAGELSAEQVAGYVAKYATAMIPAVVAVGSDPVRDWRDAWLWTCRPAVATVLVRRAVVARV